MSRRSLRPTRARGSKGARLRRTLAIALVVTGVVLETAANVVQLAESHLVRQTLSRISPSGLAAGLWHTLSGLFS